ncbi:hypothetical protein AAFF_G00154270 [Aldrovandia affinis]|uniref:Uncharacterized protein n=1 Tax=Aldrovandia affinis TaxID=143900 RepID=A0AAD7SZT2_9TELE|nr:hypothetical protein AAFF_G00154270 [Aldrovandia affinis]
MIWGTVRPHWSAVTLADSSDRLRRNTGGIQGPDRNPQYFPWLWNPRASYRRDVQIVNGQTRAALMARYRGTPLGVPASELQIASGVAFCLLRAPNVAVRVPRRPSRVRDVLRHRAGRPGLSAMMNSPSFIVSGINILNRFSSFRP